MHSRLGRRLLRPPSVDRRGALRWAGAGLVAAALPAAATTTDTTARFAVMRDDDRIGEGLVAYAREGDLLRVRVDMEAKVDFGFVTVYRYRHESEELWRDGRLVGLRGSTSDDGKTYRMTAHPTAEGLAVEGSKGDFMAPADVLPLSYWHPDTIKRSQLLDASKGRLLSLAIDAGAIETQDIGTGRVLARRYGVSGDLALTLWYDTLGAWVRTRMLKKGSPIDLVLMDPPILTIALVAPAVTGTWAGTLAPTTLASNPPNG